MASLSSFPGLIDALIERLKLRRPTILVCAAMQILGIESEESPGAKGLSIVPIKCCRFPPQCIVPQQAWSMVVPQLSSGSALLKRGYAFFSNSFCFQSAPFGWDVAESVHGGVRYIAAMASGGVLALQFHPELSGTYGLELISNWFRVTGRETAVFPALAVAKPLCRVICCMDVKNGRVVKGVKFQNLADAGDPSLLAAAYQKQGCDELVILDVSATIEERKGAKNVVKSVRAQTTLPITVGGGIKSLEVNLMAWAVCLFVWLLSETEFFRMPRNFWKVELTKLA